MDRDKLWHTFTHSGRVEDYLRYRGIDLTVSAINAVEEDRVYGNRAQTTSDDRRSDSAGV